MSLFLLIGEGEMEYLILGVGDNFLWELLTLASLFSRPFNEENNSKESRRRASCLSHGGAQSSVYITSWRALNATSCHVYAHCMHEKWAPSDYHGWLWMDTVPHPYEGTDETHSSTVFDPHTEDKANIWNRRMTHSQRAVFLSCVLGVKQRVPVNIIIHRRRTIAK